MGVRKPPGLYKEGLGLEPKARYEGSTGDSIVMKRPDESHQKTFNRKK